MRDKEMREFFEQELEIPEVVNIKMQEAYRQLGAETDKVPEYHKKRYLGARQKRRYLKAAVIACAFLAVTVTASAATQGGFQSLTKLFQGNTEQIQSSSATPEVSSDKNTFKNLKVSVEQITGTEELSYIILKVKRTDGKTFDKDKNYRFGNVVMRGENDIEKEEWQSYEGEEQSVEDSYAIKEITIDGNGSVRGTDVTEENQFTNNGILIENQGTDEICMAVACAYERSEDGQDYYHKGETVKLLLDGFYAEDDKGEAAILDAGTVQKEFVLDYGECPQIVLQPETGVRFPKYNSDSSYLPAGTLDRIVITPYFIQYERTMSEKVMKKADNTWEKIYLEMEDGTKIGYVSEQDWINRENAFGGYGDGDQNIKTKKWKTKDCMIFSTLIDVDHVKAVWFGDQRFSL